jgi:hypothetical protein
MTDDHEEGLGADLSGAWVRSAGPACAEIYPEVVIFRADGNYEAPGAADQGKVWHSGEYRLEPDGTLVVQAANDAMRRYHIVERAAQKLVLRDDAGCEVILTRA